MSDVEFAFDKKSQFFIYGCGGDGMKVASYLSSRGYHLVSFIDKRARDILDVDSVPVMTLEELDEQEQDKESVVVIISIKNIFDHYHIASELFARGYCNIIYKHYSILTPTLNDDLLMIGQVYDQMLRNEDIITGTVLSKFKNTKANNRDVLLVEEESDLNSVTVWTPIELIFNYKDGSAYEDLNMAVFFPLVDLYSALLNTPHLNIQKCIDRYIHYSAQFFRSKHMPLTESRKESLVESRVNVFTQMMKAVESNTGFFLQNAAEVVAESGIHFNMVSSGRNRVSFLIARGYRLVPLVMKRLAYEVWLNDSGSSQVVDFLEKEQTRKIFSPIPHPTLINLPVKAETYLSLFVFPAMKILFNDLVDRSSQGNSDQDHIDIEVLKEKKRECSIACAIDDDGALSRYIKSLGLPVFRLSNDSESPSACQLTALLDSLFYSGKIEVLLHSELSTTRVHAAFLDSNCFVETLNKVLSVVTAHLFYVDWENEGVAHISERGFSLERKLFTTIWDGKLVSGYYLRKSE